MAELPSVLDCGAYYLSPPPNAFWRWSDDGSAICFGDGSTILLRQELLRHGEQRLLAGRGLPPLQALVVVAAWLREPARLAALPGAPNAVPPPDPAGLRAALRHQPGLRAAFFDAVLHSAQTNALPFAERVLQVLALPNVGPWSDRAFSAIEPTVVLAWLAAALPSLTPAHLELIARTGSGELPAPIDLPWPPAGDGQALLSALAADPQLAGLVDAVRPLLGLLRLPRGLHAVMAQRLGGAAGLCNRGPLDRLLPAELAHDDDVLAVRIATNEALYLEREQPPRPPQRRRWVLVDDGLRLWGTGRRLALAVALALRADPELGPSTTFVRPDGRSVKRIDLDSRAGLIEAIERPSVQLDGRSALPELAAMVQSTQNDSGDSEQEMIVVTAARSVLDPGFLSGLPLSPGVTQLVHAIAGDGRCRLFERSTRGLRERAAAELQLAPAAAPVAADLTTPALALASWLPQLSGTAGRRQSRKEPVAIGRAAMGLLVRQRRGSYLALVEEPEGRSLGLFQLGTMAQSAAAPPLRPFQPLPPVGGKRVLSVADPGGPWWMFYDTCGWLVFVAKEGSILELAIYLDHSGLPRGFERQQTSPLPEHRLAQRFTEIMRSLPVLAPRTGPFAKEDLPTEPKEP